MHDYADKYVMLSLTSARLAPKCRNMQIPRFFITNNQIDETGARIKITDHKLVHQMSRVLRLRDGDKVIVLDGGGALFECTVNKLERTSAELVIDNTVRQTDQERQAAKELVVYLPLIKASRFEWALEKLTELGATTIVPLVTRRTVVKSGNDSDRDFKKARVGKMQEGEDSAESNVKKERWLAIVREAAEQSERLTIPKVVAPKNFEKLLDELVVAQTDPVFILAERQKCMHLATQLFKESSGFAQCKRISIFVGPEGGFTKEEIEIAAKAGLIFASLGEQILRTETAAIACATIIDALRTP